MDLAVFCYNRPDKLRMCLELVDWNRVAKLWVFCDGARGGADAAAVAETTRIAENHPFNNKTVITREGNFGPPKNIITGLDQIFAASGSCFVLEDDCLVRPEAYAYVTAALEAFVNEKRVFSVNTMSPYGSTLSKWIALRFAPASVIACRQAYAFWGWATWADRWWEFRNDLEPFQNPYGNASAVPIGVGRHVRWTLRQYEKGKVGGWDARLLALTYHGERLHLHPRVNLMKNIGMDGSGVHILDSRDGIKNTSQIKFEKYRPICVSELKLESMNKTARFLVVMEIWAGWARGLLFAIVPRAWRRKIRKRFRFVDHFTRV